MNKSLDEMYFKLKEQMNKAQSCGINGLNLNQRIEGDLYRIMNSAWLNLADVIDSQPTTKEEG
jgi:hypothetical protein